LYHAKEVFTMYEQYINIYQSAREGAGLTQERAAERIGVSVESVRMYESGKRIPPDDIVVRMVDIYDARYLAYQHIKENVKAVSSIMPMNLKVMDLPEAILRIQKEVTDFLRLRDEMVEIAYDGVISEDERPRWNVIVRELDHITEAVMNLKFVPGLKEPESSSSKVVKTA
jgi:transcriptional regulator with XRE-family HTH domain